MSRLGTDLFPVAPLIGATLQKLRVFAKKVEKSFFLNNSQSYLLPMKQRLQFLGRSLLHLMDLGDQQSVANHSPARFP